MKVTFTGLEIDSEELTSNEVPPYVPKDWFRLVISEHNEEYNALEAVREYLKKQANGRWSFTTTSGIDNRGKYIPVWVFYFEDPNDGLVMRLTGLDTIAKEYARDNWMQF